MFESLRGETSLGLSLELGIEQHKADNKFFGSCLQSFIFILFGSGVVVIPAGCGVMWVRGFVVSFIQACHN